MDFLKIIKPKQSARIFNQYILRALFGNHLRLADLADKINQAFGDSDTIPLLNAYFSITEFDTDNLSGFQILSAYCQLLELNQLQGLFAFQKVTDEQHELEPYAYEGRFIVWWVHKLASRYGWTRQEIFNLWPEEAGAYLQEILLSEIDELEQQRSLSELSYKYDKHSKKSRFIPTPKPNWMVSDDKPRMIKMRRDMIPMGEIINLDEMAKETIH